MQTNRSRLPEGPLLVVEDDPFLLSMLREVISKTGRIVYTAANGEEAVNLLQRRADIRAVVTDLAMPEMDGVRLIHWLSQEQPDMPVVVLTASASSDVQDLLERRSVEAVFQKPLTGQRINEPLGALNSLHA
ncbi:response regulator [Marinobacter shengliensis]|uniref:response regulator n=1 Tax=Marinobacter shengliensis TaxID=1389223 RepID=UPI001E4863CD|nr:response regulator [Marinobacter shengliensis]MCD1631937.1 response regulator [Marinobacter shengliensis]